MLERVSAPPRAPALDARIHSLASMARALGSSHRLMIMIETAAEEALGALGAASVSVSRVEADAGTLRTLINAGELGPGEERWPVDEVYQMRDFANLRRVVGDLRTWTTALDDPDGDPSEQELLRSLGKGSSMASPVVVDATLWGELFATRRIDDEPFDSADAAYLEALAAILAGAISRALHVEALERLAFLDPLTGLANRRALDDAAERAFATMPSGRRRRVNVVALDVNGLKAVNDALGHAEGDRLLISVAATLSRYFADLDGSLVARVGGDEFSVLVPGHGLDTVLRVADEACAAVLDLTGSSGVSCGVASTETMTVDRPGQLFRAADAAQYRAKRAGATTAVLATP